MFLSEGLAFFPAMDSKRSKTKHSSRLRGNRQIDIHSRQMMIDQDDHNRCRRAACYQRLAHLVDTGKNVKKWPLRVMK